MVNFVQSVYHLFQKRGYMKTVQMAQAMGKKTNNFVNLMRNLEKTRNFESGFGADILKVLNISEEVLKKALTIDEPEQNSFIQLINRRTQIMSNFKLQYQQDILNIVSALKKENKFTLITCQTPWEFYNRDFQNNYIKAIAKGVHFDYIFPDPNGPTVKSYYTNYFVGFPNWKYLSDQFEDYINLLLEAAEDSLFLFPEHSRNMENVEELIRQQVHCKMSDDIVLLHPSHKLMLIMTDDAEGTQEYVLEESLTGQTYSIANEDEVGFWYPLPISYAKKISSAVVRIEVEQALHAVPVPNKRIVANARKKEPALEKTV